MIACVYCGADLEPMSLRAFVGHLSGHTDEDARRVYGPTMRPAPQPHPDPDPEPLSEPRPPTDEPRLDEAA